jgi:hypothetical protein
MRQDVALTAGPASGRNQQNAPRAGAGARQCGLRTPPQTCEQLGRPIPRGYRRCRFMGQGADQADVWHAGHAGGGRYRR